jgi:hypothetical protein
VVVRGVQEQAAELGTMFQCRSCTARGCVMLVIPMCAYCGCVACARGLWLYVCARMCL